MSEKLTTCEVSCSVLCLLFCPAPSSAILSEVVLKPRWEKSSESLPAAPRHPRGRARLSLFVVRRRLQETLLAGFHRSQIPASERGIEGSALGSTYQHHDIILYSSLCTETLRAARTMAGTQTARRVLGGK